MVSSHMSKKKISMVDYGKWRKNVSNSKLATRPNRTDQGGKFENAS